MYYNQLVSQLKDAAISYSLALNKTKQNLTHDEMKKVREQVNSSHSYLIESAIKFGDYVNNSVPAKTLTDCISRMLKSSDYER